MHSHIPVSSWLIWFATTVAQACVCALMGKRQRSLQAYLVLKLAMTAVGMSVAAWGSAQAYFDVYRIAGLCGALSSAALILIWAEQLRVRSRARWNSVHLVCAWVTTCAAVTWHITAPGLRSLTPSPWNASDAADHVIWTWIALMISTVPLYCSLSGSMPDRKLCFFLFGFSLYVAANCGLVTTLISRVSTHLLYQTLKLISDFSYILCLAAWTAALHSGKRRAAASTCLLQPTERAI